MGAQSRTERSISAITVVERRTECVRQEAHARGATNRAVAAPEQARRNDMMCDKNTDANQYV